MFKHILVAIDGSAGSQGLINLAVAVAEPQAQLRLVCAVDESYALSAADIVLAPDGLVYPPALNEQHNAELIIQQGLAQCQQAGFVAQGRILVGEAAQAIVEEAGKHETEIIVIGRRHLSPFHRLLSGSVSAAVVASAPCPVLVDSSAGSGEQGD